MTDPDAVGRLLADNLTTPTEQLGRAPSIHDEAGDAPAYIEDRWQFWEYWRADEALPDTAVVSLDELKRVMDVGALTVDRIDGVDVRDAERLSDIRKDDVTSSSSTHHNP